MKSIENNFNKIEEEKISPEKICGVIQDVIDDKYELFDPEKMANYSADFSGDDPLFINIKSYMKGYGFGYIIFHDFLRRVGFNKNFFSTDFTDDGEKLFQKAVNDQLIEKVSEASGLHRLTKWKVIGDPIKNLEKIKSEIKI